MERLLALMARLRDPESGCPWDREQTWETIVPHTIEEAYEVADAIARGDKEELKNELGDLLFQVVFYSQIAEEEGAFSFQDVVASITEKMIRRHPHVFGEADYRTAVEQSAAWEHIKTAERRERPGGSMLDGVPLALPALTRALKLQRKAARVGFDWPDLSPVVDKIQEELGEIRVELDTGADAARLREEMGDILFAGVNLARHLGIDPEGALRGANGRFETRFRRIESWLAEAGRRPDQASLAEMDALWEQAKAEEQPVEKEKKEALGD